MSRKRKTKRENKMDDSWLLPYADMLTLLLALFIVLFAMSEVDVKRFKKLAYIFETEFVGGAGVIEEGVTIVPEDDSQSTSSTEKETSENDAVDDNDNDEDKEKDKEKQHVVDELNQLMSMKKEIDDYITTNSLTDTLGTKLTAEGLLITVRTDVTFDSGSSKVKKPAQKIAKEVALFLKTDPPHAIVVSGHADDRPVHNDEFASNWELSAMRAIQFMYLLLEDSVHDPKWFSAKGYGEYQPVVPNTSEGNRAINRRVEILIEPNHDLEEELN